MASSDDKKEKTPDSKYNVQIGEGESIAIGDHARVDIHTPPSAQDKKQARHRATMLERVRTIWITGFLEQLPYHSARIELELHSLPDILPNAWNDTIQEMQQLPQHSFLGTDILQVYNQSGGELLILGRPGSGKTILLLELARALLDRAKQDDAYPIPIILHLSSWATKRLPLADWLVEELHDKYHVGRAISISWVADDQVLLLLDGLDEVNKEYRTECIEAVNLYRQAHSLTPMVVCCRDSDYLEQTSRLQLGGAVMIQPLTQQQIDEYLSSRGERVDGVRLALRDDTELQELSTAPLMLTTLALAYENLPAEDLANLERTEPLPRQIFAQYVESMLHRRGISKYAHGQTMSYLAWLARQMQQNNLAEFYIERMQPDWLPTHRWLRGYTVLIFSIIILLIAPLSEWAFTTLEFSSISGQVRGMLIIPFGSACTAFVWLALCSLDIKLKLNQIRPTETIFWSEGRRKTFLSVMPIQVCGGLVIASFVSRSPLAQIAGICLGIASSIFFNMQLLGPEGDMGDVHSFTRPNYGIWLSLRNSLSAGISMGLLIAVCAGVAVGVLYGPMIGLPIGLTLGLYIGICFALGFGGRAYLQHKCLLLFLRLFKKIPRNYSRFLDYAAKRLLLRKVGGGYVFIHRALLDYFASLETTQS